MWLAPLCYNCFIRWVLILSRKRIGSRINHSLHCPDGRQTTFEEAFSKHRYCLTKSGTCMRTFHVAQVSIHRDVSRDSDVQPMSKNLVMPSSNYDGSEVVLFLDETSQNLRFISGPFSLSNSRHMSFSFLRHIIFSLCHIFPIPHQTQLEISQALA